jgi:hypothetical protein
MSVLLERFGKYLETYLSPVQITTFGLPCSHGNVAFRNGNPADSVHCPREAAQAIRLRSGLDVNGATARWCSHLSGCSWRGAVLVGCLWKKCLIFVAKRQVVIGTT